MNAKITRTINTPEDARALAQNMAQLSQEGTENRKNVILKSIEELDKIRPDFGGFDGVALLLALPEEQFSLLAPVFL